MGGDFNVRLAEWDPTVHSVPPEADVLTDLADSFGLERSIPENPVPTFYSSDPNHANTVIDLMFTASSIGRLVSH